MRSLRFAFRSRHPDHRGARTQLMAAVIACVLVGNTARADIGIISPAEAKKLIENADPAKRPIVLDTRGGYKDYFRGHLPTAHHLNFDTLRGTDNGVPVQYLPDDLTKALLVRAGVDKDRTHLIYATGDKLPNDEILSASMVAYVLEKFGVEDIRIVDGGLPEWTKQKLPVTQEYFGNPKGTLPEKGKPGDRPDRRRRAQAQARARSSWMPARTTSTSATTTSGCARATSPARSASTGRG